ncbi:MAG: glycosyltransferase [Oligosphaeraceae bacterium]|nr:glycosyltransferase [Oligosphaeraceae bacterium]
MARILLVDCAPFCGGAQESLLTLALELSARGQQLQLLCADASPGGLAERAAAGGLMVRKFPCRHWPASLPGLLQYCSDRRRFRDVWRDLDAAFQPQIIIANGLRSAVLLQRSLPPGVPMILHDRDLHCPALLPRMLVKSCAAVIAISTAVSEKWRCLLPDGRLFVIYNGFDLQSLAALPAPPRSAGRPFSIILAADFLPWKGHQLFLQSLARLPAGLPEWQAVIRGRVRSSAGEQYRRKITALAERLGLREKLSIIDRPGGAWQDIANADLLVSCSENEPFGRTLIEALALGKPVLAVAGGGVQEILSGCAAARICPADPAALAAAIQNLQAQLPDREWERAARTHAAKFSSAVYAEQVLTVCTSLLEVSAARGQQ